MLVSTCLIELILLFILFYNKNNGIRRSIIIASVSWAIILIISTEVLSIMNWLTQRNLAILWILSIISTFFLIKRKSIKFKISFNNTLDIKDKIILFTIISFTVGTFLSAILFPPRNWDSMTYHMARVANWVQNHSVHHYATHIPRQLFSGVYAEYVILNTYLLVGNDSLSNVVQWFYYIVSIIVVSAIAKNLGLSKKGQLIASFLYASMPMVVMQASTTQNDVTAAFWALAFVYFALDIIKLEKLSDSSENIFLLFMLSSCLAAGLLTKATSLFAICPFLLWILIDVLRKKNSLKFITLYAAISLLTILIINIGYFSQNYKTEGSVLASSQNTGVMIDTHNPKLLFVNILKNTFMELNIDLRDQEGQNITEHIALDFLSMLGKTLDINFNDPSISYYNIPFAIVTGIYHEDISGNPWFMFFAIISIFIILTTLIKNRKLNVSLKYSFMALFSFFILSLSIKWQPWITRLLTPSIALLSLVPSIAIENLLLNARWKRILTFLIILVNLVTSMEPLLLQRGQPLLFGMFLNAHEKISTVYKENILNHLDRYNLSAGPSSKVYKDFIEDSNVLYYFNNMSEYISYKNLINFVKENNYTDIGLTIGGDTYEYPLWMSLKTPETELKHVSVNNISKIYEDPLFIPECILVINNDIYKGADKVVYHNQEYIKAYVYDKNHYIYVQKSKYSAPGYELGERIELNIRSKHQGDGWSFPENWGTWTDGVTANLSMNIKSSENDELFLHVDIDNIFTTQPVDVSVNDQLVGLYQFSKGNNTIKIPSTVLSSDGNVNIVFKFKNPQSPKSLGMSNEERQLGIGVKEFSITNSEDHAPVYQLGEVIELNTRSKYQGGGWSFPENWGTWTDGAFANLNMNIKNSENEELFLHVDVEYVFTPSPVDVLVNDQLVGSYQFLKGDNKINIPKSVVGSGENVSIGFKINNPQSPKSLDVSNEERKLGIGVKAFSITNSK